MFDPINLAASERCTSQALAGIEGLNAASILLREHRTVDHESELGVQIPRARIEIKRADENPRAVGRESFGVRT